ncbi:MAG TPA: cation:proton antiporter [Acetobacteraceae bacterium]|nr:cation:proton antiporter [Acetobacteraceae bacterium]
MTDAVAIAVLCIAVAGMAAQWLAWKIRLPAIVLLFVVGLVFGPALHVLQPARDFGPALPALVGLAVAIVVFEGGLGLDFRELRTAGEGVLRLTTFALPVSFALATLAARLLTGMGWGSAALYGAITVVTGPTVILPMLRQTRLNRRSASFLKWEAIVNDPIGAILSAIVLSVLVAEGRAGRSLPVELVSGLAVAIVLGIGAALLVRLLFIRDQMPEVLKTPVLLALALGVYAVSNVFMDEAGLAAATIFGMSLANLRIPGLAELARFKEALVVLLVSALFVVLTASLQRSVFSHVSWPLLLLTLAMLFVVRPLSIFLATLGTGLTWQERVMSGWIAPRGIVAAAVAGIASTQLMGAHVQGAELVMPAVFALIAATMVLHGFTAAPLARRLGLTLGDAPGLAILGASPWSTDMATTLSQAGVSVLLIDTFPGALDGARKRNLPVLQVEILSEHGAEELANQRVDYLFAATQNDVYNSMVCIRLAPELGRRRVFQLAPGDGEIDNWIGLSREWRGEAVGDPPLDFVTFRHHYRQGWRFSITELEEAEGKAGPEGAVTLAIIRPGGGLVFTSAEENAGNPGAGDKVLIFAPPLAGEDEAR